MRRCVSFAHELIFLHDPQIFSDTHIGAALSFEQMRQYLKQDEKWKDWENLEVKWIQHHNPDLVVLDDNGKEKVRMDLQGLTAGRLEQILDQHGFKRR